VNELSYLCTFQVGAEEEAKIAAVGNSQSIVETTKSTDEGDPSVIAKRETAESATSPVELESPVEDGLEESVTEKRSAQAQQRAMARAQQRALAQAQQRSLKARRNRNRGFEEHYFRAHKKGERMIAKFFRFLKKMFHSYLLTRKH